MTVSDVGEFGLIRMIAADLPTSDAVIMGTGDDAAVLTIRGAAVWSTDTMVEEVHFRRNWSSAKDVGRKIVGVSVADLEAMGARPVGILIALAVPVDLDVQWVLDFAAGVRQECARCGALLLGGDTTRSRDITITASVLGELGTGRSVTRSGAKAGDLIAVCGRLGYAAAGLAVLSRGFRSPRAVVEAQRYPEPPYGQGAIAAANGATAMIDVSDGLLADLAHIAESSAVVINVSTSSVPVGEPLRAVAGALGGSNPLRYVLTGGEDHALAAAFPNSLVVPPGWTIIGEVIAGEQPGVLVDGKPWIGKDGWTHF